MEQIELKSVVQDRYSAVAEGRAQCGALCGCSDNAELLAQSFGYTRDELRALPDGANLGLSCGKPLALANLAPGLVVVDLGSGAGFDALQAAAKVWPTGRVIGVDMTNAMLARARANAIAAGLDNVEFVQGDIEQLPLPDAVADVAISNCVLNLCADKDRAFREIYRVLRPGGRLAVSDMAWEVEPPPEVRRDLEAIVGCIGGALVLDDYVSRLTQAGFREIQIEKRPEMARAMIELSGVRPPPGVEQLFSVTLAAVK